MARAVDGGVACPARGTIAPLVLLVALAACVREPPLPPLPVDPPDEVRDVEIEGQWITARLQIPDTPPGPKPVVIAPTGDADILLGAGAIVVTYSVNWHLLAGLKPPEPAPPPPRNTVGTWLLASPTPKTVGKVFLTLIDYNAQHAIPKVIDHLVTLPEVDPARIGVAGSSTNGFTALQAAAADPRIAAAAVVVACGDYHGFLHRSSLAMNGRRLDLDPAYDAWLREREPIRRPDRLVHAAVLMVNGAEDVAVPAACATRTAHALRRAYARAGVPERYRFVLIPGSGHNLDERAAQEVLAWWWRWLLRPP